jgi:hypothetical protein
MEKTVAKAKTKVKAKSKKVEPEKLFPAARPWISMRSGVRVVALASLGMAILTAWQVVPVKGWLEGILWGLFFGVLILAIFFGMYWFNRLMRR